MSILNLWKERIVEQKWLEGLSSNKVISKENLDVLTDKLLQYIPKNHFELASNDLISFYSKDWLYAILNSNYISSVYQLIEILNLLEFRRTNSLHELYKLFKIDGSLNLDSFRETLFEISINRFLTKSGFNVINNAYYLDANGNEKPLDACITFKGEHFLVECTKLRNSKYEILLSLTNKIKELLIENYGNDKTNIQDFIGGYIGFHSEKSFDSIANSSFDVFKKQLKKYIHGQIIGDDNTIEIPKKFKSDNFDVHIFPHFNLTIDSSIKDIVEEYKSYVTFEVKASQGIKGSLQIIGNCKINHNNLHRFISNKIKKKFTQHSTANINKIVFVEIENTLLHNLYANSLPIDHAGILSLKLNKFLVRKNIIVIIFKEIDKHNIRYKKYIYHKSNIDSELLAGMKKVYD